jgi:hypothetical protein
VHCLRARAPGDGRNGWPRQVHLRLGRAHAHTGLTHQQHRPE